MSPAPTPTPTPTPSSSEDALHAEAERVYMASVEARWKYELTGDYSEFPPELADYYTPEYLAAVRAVFEDGRQSGVMLTGGRPVVEVGPARDTPRDGADVVIETCQDSRGLTLVNAAGDELHQGVLVHGLAYLVFSGDMLKIERMTFEEVTECALG